MGAAFTPLSYQSAASWAAQLAHLLGAPACSCTQAAACAYKERPVTERECAENVYQVQLDCLAWSLAELQECSASGARTATTVT